MAALAHVARKFAAIVSRFTRSCRARLRPRKPAVSRKGVAADALLRVYLGREGRWYVKREGDAPVAAFRGRLQAVEFARLLGMGAGSYRILFETVGSSVLEERFIPR